MLIYYAVRFLKHNLPDKLVGMFLHNYFDASSGLTQNDELTAPALKRQSMTTGIISLNEFGIHDALRFMWVGDEPQDENAPQDPRTMTPQPDYNHPLNELINTLLSWFSALYTLENLPEPSSGSARSHARSGGKFITVGQGPRTSNASVVNAWQPNQLSPEKLAKLKLLAARLDNQLNVLALIEKISPQPFPEMDKGRDKRPEKGYAPCSPETPQFSEVSGFTDSDAESGEQLDDGGAEVPDGPGPNAFAPLAADADGERRGRRAATVVSVTGEDHLEYGDRPRTPSPTCLSRPKRGREDDAAPATFAKRSRY